MNQYELFTHKEGGYSFYRQRVKKQSRPFVTEKSVMNKIMIGACLLENRYNENSLTKTMTEDMDWVKRRLNSVMDILEGGSAYVGGSSTNADFYLPKEGIKILKEIKEKCSDNNLIPDIKEFEDLKKEGYQYAQKLYVFSKVKEIADALGITLSKDEEKQSSTIMAQYQNQVSTQVNLQTVDNVIECINSLDIKWDQKTELVQLTKDFEEAAKEKDEGKLKSILKKVAVISPKVAGFLLEHATELGLLASLL